jgi:hypothetical protein
MPSLGLVTGSRRTGHQTPSGKPILALKAKVSIRVLTEALGLRVWPNCIAADARFLGLQMTGSREDDLWVWMGPLRRT